MLFGIICDYDSGPIESWTVPPAIAAAEFVLYGADVPGASSGGRVEATLPVEPGQVYTLGAGGSGSATSVSLNGINLLVAGGGDGSEPNYVAPVASNVETEEPGALLTGFALNGSIYVSWWVGG